MNAPTPDPHPGQPGQQAPSPTRRTGLVLIITSAVVVVLAIAAVAGYLVLSRVWHLGAEQAGTQARAIRVTSGKLITKPGSDEPKAVLALYEDFLCPACGHFEDEMGSTVTKLIDAGAVAADYYPVAILDYGGRDYSSRAGAAAYCVADESIEAFRRFHAALFTAALQPAETATQLPDDAWLIEIARQAGAVGGVPGCIKDGKYLGLVRGAAQASGVTGTPTVRINGEDYQWSTTDAPEALVRKIKEIVGDVPGL